jgi:hypothetical protein
VERTGIEPVTSGLQILSWADQAWSKRPSALVVKPFPNEAIRRERSTKVSLI